MFKKKKKWGVGGVGGGKIKTNGYNWPQSSQ